MSLPKVAFDVQTSLLPIRRGSARRSSSGCRLWPDSEVAECADDFRFLEYSGLVVLSASLSESDQFRHAVATTAAGIAEPDLGSRGLRPFAIDPCCLSHKRGGPLINESDRSFCSKRLPTARSGNTRSGSPGEPRATERSYRSKISWSRPDRQCRARGAASRAYDHT